ncbi:uncharacterized protein [Anabrus simplex]|uniref:uncharacterized protein n=1 Tax=Anabrus simplex TaxID=316456 RepID=UPI0035A2EFF7
MSDCGKEDNSLDILYEMPSHYFKSSFARSIISDSQNQCRSLDYVHTDNTVIGEKCRTMRNDYRSFNSFGNYDGKNKSLGLKQYQPHNSVFQSPNEKITPRGSRLKSLTNGELKSWKSTQETKRKVDTSQQNGKGSLENQPTSEADLLRLRKECQGLVEENRRLQAALASKATTLSPADQVDNAILQSQVDTLSWQLKQTESSRQMYREVMEEVVKFLERAHKNLDILQQSMSPGTLPSENSVSQHCRVPRSRSVHTVDVSPSRGSPRSDSVLHFPRAKSIAQIEASPNYSTFRDFTWRRPRKSHSDNDGVPPEKLSQEAFRLLRIVQSLLNTREPDLAHRLSSNCSETGSTVSNSLLVPHSGCQRNSGTSTIFDLPDEKGSVNELPFLFNRKLSVHDHNPSPLLSCSSPVQSSYGILHESLDTSSIHSSPFKPPLPLDYNNTALTSGLESDFAGSGSKSRSSPSQNQDRSDKDSETNGYSSSSGMNKQQLSEDESGFSSMSSFQEVGLPLVSPSSGCYQEVGLPLVDHRSSPDSPLPGANHRRWNSSPVDTQTPYPRHNRSFCLPGETLQVLWV